MVLYSNHRFISYKNTNIICMYINTKMYNSEKIKLMLLKLIFTNIKLKNAPIN